MTARKNEEDQGAVMLRYGKVILLGGAVALVSSLLLLLAAAVCVSKGVLDGGLRYQLTVVSCVLGSFLGGVFAVRKGPGRGMLVGLAVGGVLFLVELSLGMALFEGATLGSGSVGLLFGDLCGGAAAGILAGGGGRRRGGRMKKRRGR